MAKATFDQWLRGSHLLEASGSIWKIGVRDPFAVDWLTNRLGRVVERTVSPLAGHDLTLQYVVAAPPPAPRPPWAHDLAGDSIAPSHDQEPGTAMDDPRPATSSPTRHPASSPGLDTFLSFDPNTADGGGFWMLGNYASWFWAAFLSAVAWRVYELVVAGDKRRHKTPWTPPRRYCVSELARNVASGRGCRPNRDQIRGRYRTIAGEQRWRPGAFDQLTHEDDARVEWHDGSVRWQPWFPGGTRRRGRSGLRRGILRAVYRLSVVTRLPVLTPHQVARLPAEHQVAHERHLADRGLDLLAWEQITLPTLAGLDQTITTDARAPVTDAPAADTGAPATDTGDASHPPPPARHAETG
jgi:hypothetical protein